MSGKLTNKFMDQLEQWIGTGPKTFDLLYSITRDGCSNTAFHQKCDNQGPTVTVLYNQQNSIYGGYTGCNWDQSGTWGNDSTAFLFQLQYNGSATVNKFLCKQPGNAIYRHAPYGPAFGSGHDLYTFNGTINNSGGYYTLNGYGFSNLGNSYNNQGITANQINNGTMNVTELEVYQVKNGKRKVQCDKPWRATPEWNLEFLENLMSEVDGFSPPPAVKVAQSRILIIGPVGAGKSSFFNTIASVFRGKVTGQAPSGCSEHSVTSQYCLYQVRSSSSGRPLNFRLCDTRGLQETQGIDANDMGYLLDGNVPDGYVYRMYQSLNPTSKQPLKFCLYDIRGLEDGQGIDANDISYLLDGKLPDGFQFNPSVPVCPETPGFKKKTTLRDRVCCVCIVIDGSTGGVLPVKMVEKIKSIQSKINVREIPQMLLLTKVDKICPNAIADISQVFTSPAILEQVQNVSQLLGLLENQILPTKNYITETELEENGSILVLLTIRQILRASVDYREDFLDDGHCDSDDASVPTPD